MNFDQRYSHIYIYLLINYNEIISTLLAILPGLLLHFVSGVYLWGQDTTVRMGVEILLAYLSITNTY